MLVTSVISSADNTHVFYEGIADCRLQIVISVPSSVYFLFLVSHLMSNIFVHVLVYALVLVACCMLRSLILLSNQYLASI
jgi:hypothetical protein